MARLGVAGGLDGGSRAASPFPGCAVVCAQRLEADHRVANHLTMLASYVRLKGAEIGNPAGCDAAAARLLMQSIDAQIHAVARLHRLLTSANEGCSIDLPTLLHEVCAPFARGFEQDFVLVEDFAADCLVRPEQILPVSQIVAECIANAAKYAFHGAADGVVVVRCHALPSGDVRIEVIDNGKGLAADIDPRISGGFGFHLMRNLSASLRAPLDFDSRDKGLCVRVTLPAIAL